MAENSKRDGDGPQLLAAPAEPAKSAWSWLDWGRASAEKKSPPASKVAAVVTAATAAVTAVLWRSPEPSPSPAPAPKPDPQPQPAPEPRPEPMPEAVQPLRPDEWPSPEAAPAPEAAPSIEPARPALETKPKLDASLITRPAAAVAPSTGSAWSLSNLVSPNTAAVLGAALALASIPALLFQAAPNGEPMLNPFAAHSTASPLAVSALPQPEFAVQAHPVAAAAPAAAPAPAPATAAAQAVPSSKVADLLHAMRDAPANSFARLNHATTSRATGIFHQQANPAPQYGDSHPQTGSAPQAVPFCQHQPGPGQTALHGLPFCSDVAATGKDPSAPTDTKQPVDGVGAGVADSSPADAGNASTGAGGGDAGCSGDGGGDGGGGDGG